MCREGMLLQIRLCLDLDIKQTSALIQYACIVIIMANLPGTWNICHPKKCCIHGSLHLANKGLVTYYGEGGYEMGGGHVKFYPHEKGERKMF